MQPSLSIFSLLIPCISSKLRKAALSRGGMNIKFYLILTFLGPPFFLIYLTLIQMEFSSTVGVGGLQWAEYLQGRNSLFTPVTEQTPAGSLSPHPTPAGDLVPLPTPCTDRRGSTSVHSLRQSRAEGSDTWMTRGERGKEGTRVPAGPGSRARSAGSQACILGTALPRD